MLLLSVLVASLFERSAEALNATGTEALCSQQKSYVTERYENRETFDQIFSGDRVSRSQLIIFGESHTERSTKFYAYAIAKLREQRSDLDCLFIEQPHDQYEQAVDACNTNLANCDRSQLPDFSGIKQAYDAGLRVYPVDAEPIEGFGDFMNSQTPITKDFLENVQKRNSEMARRSADLLETKTCHAALLIIGSMHAHTYPGIESISDFLRERKIANYKIELASPGYNSFDRLDQKWIWTQADGHPICKEVAALKGENFGFENRPADRLPVLYGAFSDPGTSKYEFLGRWNDYDASLFIGCADPAKQTCEFDSPDSTVSKIPRYLE